MVYSVSDKLLPYEHDEITTGFQDMLFILLQINVCIVVCSEDFLFILFQISFFIMMRSMKLQLPFKTCKISASKNKVAGIVAMRLKLIVAFPGQKIISIVLPGANVMKIVCHTAIAVQIIGIIVRVLHHMI